MASLTRITQNNVNKFMESFDTILFDCDDVLWHTNVPVAGAVEAVKKIRKFGKQVLFVTNNNFNSRDQFMKKFEDHGHVVSKEEIFSSAVATGVYMRDIVMFAGKAYVIGSQGLHDELTEHGIECCPVGPDPVEDDDLDFLDIELDPDVTAVIVGMDKYISYLKIFKAASYLYDPEILFIGTNTDANAPCPGKNKVKPGTGSIVKTVEVASLRSATIMGKPSKLLFDCIKAKYNVDPKRTLMVGDRYNTDILFGKRCGLKTLAVLTGILKEEELVAFQESDNPHDHLYVPDYLINSVGDFVDLLKD